MRDKTLLTIILIIAICALLDWMGVDGEDLIESIRRLSYGENRLLGWAVLALVAYTVYRVINHIMR